MSVDFYRRKNTFQIIKYTQIHLYLFTATKTDVPKLNPNNFFHHKSFFGVCDEWSGFWVKPRFATF